jgi:transposase InsO family protein
MQYDFKVIHIPGVTNLIADALSRILCVVGTEKMIVNVEVSTAQTDIKLPTQTNTSMITTSSSSTLQKRKRRGKSAEKLPASRSILTPPDSDEINALATPPVVLARLIEGRQNLTPHQRFEVVHNADVGHNGIERTIQRLRMADMLWDGYSKDVESFIKECAVCQKVRLNQPVISPALAVTCRWEPFECFAIDVVGPLPIDSQQYQYVVVCIDLFTRYVELIPVKDNSAASIAKSLFQLFGRYGMVREIQSDNGGNLASGVIDELMKWMGMKHRYTLPYRPEANGIAERVNSSLLKHLNGFIMELRIKPDWSVVLPLVQRIINATPHVSIGTTPVRMIYGDRMTTNQGLLEPLPGPHPGNITVEGHIQDLNASLKMLHAAAVKHQQREVQFRLADTPTNPTKYAVGELVLASYPVRPTDKLTPRWFGPLKILSVKNQTYECQNLADNVVTKLFIKRLKPYREDPIMSAQAAALVDKDQYLVNAILSHRFQSGKRKSVSRLLFKVNWIGFSASQIDEIPWSRVRNNLLIDDYIGAHPELAKFAGNIAHEPLPPNVPV